MKSHESLILLYFFSLVLGGCGSDILNIPDSEDWQPVLTRAESGTTGTMAGFASADSYFPKFGKKIVSDGTTWQWEDGMAPSLSGVSILAASIPYVDMSTGTRSFSQSHLSSYPKGLMIGAVALDGNSERSVKVNQCLAQLNISCKGSYFLSSSINLYLCQSASVDFRKGTLTTNTYKSYYEQSMVEQKSAVLPIFPQTFYKGDLLFRYHYGSGTYSYRLTENYVVGANQSLNIRIASGDEDYKPDVPPVVTITVTSQITEWTEDGDVPVNGDAQITTPENGDSDVPWTPSGDDVNVDIEEKETI